MALEMNLNVAPSNCVLVFDGINYLTEDEHKRVFDIAVNKFINCVILSTGSEAELLLPSDIYLKEKGESWVNISDLSINSLCLSNWLYMLNDFEFSTQLKYLDEKYEMHFSSDPIAFRLEREVSAPAIVSTVKQKIAMFVRYLVVPAKLLAP